MNDHRDPRRGFEQELGDRLKLFVAERGASIEAKEATIGRTSTARRIGPRVAAGSAVAGIAAVAVLALSAGSSSTSSAYAVETLPGGGTLIRVSALEDAAGVESALEEAGVHAQVNWLEAGMTCREPHFTEATHDSGVHSPGVTNAIELVRWQGSATAPKSAGGVVVAIGAQEAESGKLPADEVLALSIDPAAFTNDQTLVISGAPYPYGGDPEGSYMSKTKIAEGEVGPCEPVMASAN